MLGGEIEQTYRHVSRRAAACGNSPSRRIYGIINRKIHVWLIDENTIQEREEESIDYSCRNDQFLLQKNGIRDYSPERPARSVGFIDNWGNFLLHAKK